MKTLSLCLLVLSFAGAARPDNALPKVVNEGTSKEGSLKATITVVAKGLSSYLSKTGVKDPKFVLYLNEVPFKGLSKSVPDAGHDHVQFYLDRLDTNREQWATLQRNPVATRDHVLLTI